MRAVVRGNNSSFMYRIPSELRHLSIGEVRRLQNNGIINYDICTDTDVCYITWTQRLNLWKIEHTLSTLVGVSEGIR